MATSIRQSCHEAIPRQCKLATCLGGWKAQAPNVPGVSAHANVNEVGLRWSMPPLVVPWRPKNDYHDHTWKLPGARKSQMSFAVARLTRTPAALCKRPGRTSWRKVQANPHANKIKPSPIKKYERTSTKAQLLQLRERGSNNITEHHSGPRCERGSRETHVTAHRVTDQDPGNTRDTLKPVHHCTQDLGYATLQLSSNSPLHDLVRLRHDSETPCLHHPLEGRRGNVLNTRAQLSERHLSTSALRHASGVKRWHTVDYVPPQLLSPPSRAPGHKHMPNISYIYTWGIGTNHTYDLTLASPITRIFRTQLRPTIEVEDFAAAPSYDGVSRGSAGQGAT